MKKYTVTAIFRCNGMMVHITGEWENDDQMRAVLEGSGFIIAHYTKE